METDMNLLRTFCVTAFALAAPAAMACENPISCGWGATNGWSVTGNGSTLGLGLANFGGTTGNAFTVQNGSSTGVLDMNASGNLCGPDCSSVHFAYTGRSAQDVASHAFGASDHAGTPATVMGETHAVTFQSLQMQRWYQGLSGH